MKRRIGSVTAGRIQTPIAKRIRITNVKDMTRFMTTVFDKSCGKFETSGANETYQQGAYYVVNTSTPVSENNSSNQRFALSGALFTLTKFQHGLSMSKPTMFSFMRRDANGWIYDVESLEVRVNDVDDSITVASNIDMAGIYVLISQ